MAKARFSSQMSHLGKDFTKSRASAGKPTPTPYNFDEFVPWMCLLWQSPDDVIVIKLYQEEYVKAVIQNRRHSSKSVKGIKAKIESEVLSYLYSSENKMRSLKPIASEKNVQIKAYYNLQENLTELAIVGCPFSINPITFQVLGLAVPYHTTLTKLSITRGGLTAYALHEIAKFLPQSFLTDICLDDTKVSQLNYPELLKTTTKLKNLSLKRCQLGDACCKEIAACIETDTPGSSLRTLDLSSNTISDEGAIALADVLRRNRQLLHLGLAGNIITDKGAMAILNSLKEFPMRNDEIVNMKVKRLEYNRLKVSIYADLVKEMLIAKQRAEDRFRASRSRSNKSVRSDTSSKAQKSVSPKKGKKLAERPPSTPIPSTDSRPGIVDYTSTYSEIEQKVKEKIGEFRNTFDAHHVFLRDKYFYCVGNMYLCSLNLAYNNMEYSSVKMIREVLEYQSELKKPPGSTGLMRIVFDGNYVPKYCDEYVDIDTFLQKAVTNQLQKTTPPVLKKKVLPTSR